MAEEEHRDVPATSASTPNSTTGDQGGLKASKDRNCPFCGQAFTSSSLGRHLDLYIKPKNPKPPDGVHDVDEIRKRRGGITRRQPRTSLKVSTDDDDGSRRNSSTWSNPSSTKHKKGDSKTEHSTLNSPISAKETNRGVFMNAPGWEATGVINDLPARSSSRNQTSTPTGQAQRLQEMRRDNAGNRIERPDYATSEVWKLQESAEIGRAAEMALREVLGSLEAARKKIDPPKLYEDFDFCTLSFPGLCLAILPPPPGLFSTTPFAAAHTWSLSPPGEKQFDALSRYFRERVTLRRREGSNAPPDSVIFTHHVHMENAYEHWTMMPDSEKQASWNLEVSRAFIREKEKREQLRSDLDTAEQRIRQLEAEFDRLSRCQLPREYIMHPPKTVPVSTAVMREMKTSELRSGAYEVDFDAEALINKWKSTVKAATRPHRPPPTETHQYVEPRRNPLKGDMMLNGTVFGVNGPMPRDTDTNETRHEHNEITYETPRVPGMVTSAEEETNGEADVDAEGEVKRAYPMQEYDGNSALIRLRNANQGANESSVNGLLNANGKRGLGPGVVGGRSAGPKVYRETPQV